MNPFQPPLPTIWNLPFQPAMGSQTSDLISESLEGFSVISTRQNAGRSPKAAAPLGPFGSWNAPDSITFAEFTLLCGSASDLSRPHAAASTAACAAGASAITSGVPAT